MIVNLNGEQSKIHQPACLLDDDFSWNLEGVIIRFGGDQQRRSQRAATECFSPKVTIGIKSLAEGKSLCFILS